MILTVLSLIVEATHITKISNSNSVYSISSTFVQVDKFNTQYTIYDRTHSFNNSKNLISSTIVDDYDKNSNIGYVVNGSDKTLNTGSLTRPC